MTLLNVVIKFVIIIIKGQSRETRADKLRSIVAQMVYADMIDKWNQQGVPFRKHLYVPEIHPITKTQFHER